MMLTGDSDTHRLKVKEREKKRYSMKIIIKREQEYLYLHQTKYAFSQISHKRKRRIAYNGKEVNSSRRYNNSKYICTQHWNIYIYKAILTELKGEIDTKNNSKALQYSLSSVDRLSWQKINKKNSRLD